MTTIPTITPLELKKKMDDNDTFVLIDVREPHEAAFCSLPNSILIPLQQIPGRSSEIDKNSHVIVYCRSGGRSADAVNYLMSIGFSKITNLGGGILRWSDDVDQSVPKY